MKENPKREERGGSIRRSLSAKTVRSTILSCVVFGLVSLLVALTFYAVSMTRQYISFAGGIANHAALSAQATGAPITLTDEVMEIYGSLSEEQRQQVYRSMEAYNGEYGSIEGEGTDWYGSFDPETYGISRDAPAFALLKAVSEYTPEDWDMLSREGQLNALYESLSQAAIGDGQVRRDIYVMTAFLHADGAYSEMLAAVLRDQYEADPDAWGEALAAFPEEEADLLRRMAEEAGEGGTP